MTRNDDPPARPPFTGRERYEAIPLEPVALAAGNRRACPEGRKTLSVLPRRPWKHSAL